MPQAVMTHKPDSDPVSHPAHYTAFGVEVIDITEHLSFCAGNAVKYLARAGLKDPDKHIEDLRKASWYVQREIQRIERQGTTMRTRAGTDREHVTNFIGQTIRTVFTQPARMLKARPKARRTMLGRRSGR